MRKFKSVVILALGYTFSVVLNLSGSSQEIPDDVKIDTTAVDRDFRKEASEKMDTEHEAKKDIEEVEPEIVPVGIKVFIKKINLVGVRSFASETFDPLVSKYVNRKVARNELEALAKKIQREYLRKGIIAACFIPPQEVRDGIIKFQVVEARMGDLSVVNNKYFDNDMLKAFWTSRYGEVIKYKKLARNLDIINRNPDKNVSVSLQAGADPETTDVILDSKTEFPYHFTASFDREGNPKTGKARKGAGFRTNNFLFVDDMLITGYTYGQNFSNIYFYHKIPVTNIGTSIMYGTSYSRSSPKKDQAYLGLLSLSQNSSVYLYQNLFKNIDYIGDIQLGLDFKDKTTSYTGGVHSRDRFRVLRLAGKLKFPYLGGQVYLNPELSQGLNIFGARRKDRLASRTNTVAASISNNFLGGRLDDGVENTFTKFVMDLTFVKPLPYDLSLKFRLREQLTETKLVSSEGLSMGGINSIRGYPSSDFIADQGTILNLELKYPFYFIPDNFRFPYGQRPIKKELSGIFFVDYGHGERRGVLDSLIAGSRGKTKREVDCLSIGTGIRMHLFNQAYLRLEWGIPIGLDRPITESSPNRIHFSIDVEEHLSREVKNLGQRIENDRSQRQAMELLDKELNRPNSPVRSVYYDYIILADNAKINGRLEEEKMWNEKIVNTSRSLFSQALDYVRRLMNHEKDLERNKTLAKKLLEIGEYEKSMKIWEKIIQNSQFEDFKLSIKL